MESKIINLMSVIHLDSIYIKYRQAITYLFFGVASTIVNIASFWFCESILGINYQIANVISWILAVFCAYITNKLWVFESKCKSKKENVSEATMFYFFRIVSLGIEMGILYLLYDLCNFNVMFSKILANIISIAANFVFSKLIIFRTKKELVRVNN